MKKENYLFLLLLIVFISACKKEVVTNNPEAPTIYAFSNNGKNSVDFTGQRIRMDMHKQLEMELKKAPTTEIQLSKIQDMYEHQMGNSDFENGNIFSAEILNSSDKQLANKSGSSTAYQPETQDYFVGLLTKISKNSDSKSKAVKGQIGILDRKEDGSSKILVDENGLEYVQIFTKGLMGAVELDQILNIYLSSNKLEVENDKKETDKNYTKMEHHWDEAFGYTSLHPNTLKIDNVPDLELEQYDQFWGEYIQAVNNTVVGAGIKEKIMSAFLKGRQAIVNKNYDNRDEQVKIIKQALSKVCAIQAVTYLIKGKALVLSSYENEKADAFHAISEAYGFIYSLQFSNNGNDLSYFSKKEIESFLDQLKNNGGLYNENIENILEDVITDLCTKFNFSKSDF